MLGKKKSLKILIKQLNIRNVTNIRTFQFIQGYTTRWMLAWSFTENFIEISQSELYKIKSKKLKSEFNFSVSEQSSPINILNSIDSFFEQYDFKTEKNLLFFTLDATLYETVGLDKTDDVVLSLNFQVFKENPNKNDYIVLGKLKKGDKETFLGIFELLKEKIQTK